METKLTKQELLDQLAEITKKEQEEQDELFFEKYKDMSFLKIFKSSINWINAGVIYFLVLLVSLFNMRTTPVVAISIPLLYILLGITHSFELRQKINFMKKKRSL